MSDLAEHQQGGRSAAQLAHLAAVTSSERNRLKKHEEKNKSTEMLLQEKDEQLDAAGGFCNVRVEQRAFASVRYAL